MVEAAFFLSFAKDLHGRAEDIQPFIFDKKINLR